MKNKDLEIRAEELSIKFTEVLHNLGSPTSLVQYRDTMKEAVELLDELIELEAEKMVQLEKGVEDNDKN